MPTGDDVTFLFVADDKSTAIRVVHNAREIYESARERRKTLKLAANEAAQLVDRMERIRARLRFLGKSV